MFLFSSNCFIERKFFCRNFSGGFVKSGFQVSAGKFWWQGLFFNKTLNIFGRGPNTSQFCVANFPMELTKLYYTCSINSFEREVFQKNVNFFIKSEYWLNSSSVSRIFFRLDCQNNIPRVCRKSMEKKFVETCKSFHEIGTLSKKLSAFGRNFSERIAKSAFYVLLVTIREKHFFELF